MQTATSQPRTINEARTIANIEARARTLFAEGYSYKRSPVAGGLYIVSKPAPPHRVFGDFYVVNTNTGRCNCKAFTHFRTCKHLQAVRNELAADAALCREYDLDMACCELYTGCDAE